MDPEKVNAIKNWPSLKSVFEVRSFHGLASSYRKFMQNFSGISAPMMDMVKKRHKYFHWTKEVEKIFNLLKKKIFQITGGPTIMMKMETSMTSGMRMSKLKRRSMMEMDIQFNSQM